MSAGTNSFGNGLIRCHHVDADDPEIAGICEEWPPSDHRGASRRPSPARCGPCRPPRALASSRRLLLLVAALDPGATEQLAVLLLGHPLAPLLYKQSPLRIPYLSRPSRHWSRPQPTRCSSWLLQAYRSRRIDPVRRFPRRSREGSRALPAQGPGRSDRPAQPASRRCARGGVRSSSRHASRRPPRPRSETAPQRTPGRGSRGHLHRTLCPGPPGFLRVTRLLGVAKTNWPMWWLGKLNADIASACAQNQEWVRGETPSRVDRESRGEDRSVDGVVPDRSPGRTAPA